MADSKTDGENHTVPLIRTDLIIITTAKDYVLSGDFRFVFGGEVQTFTQVAEALDEEIRQFRTRALKKIASHLGVAVKFED